MLNLVFIYRPKRLGLYLKFGQVKVRKEIQRKEKDLKEK
jgi:hypothetical protein